MNNLSIEELKDMREFAQKHRYTRFVRLIDEAIAIRELKGDQVPVITCYSCRKVMTRDQHAEADGFCPHCDVEIELDKDELFTAPQKPVVLPKSHYVCGCADRYMSAPEVIAAIEAAGGVVKDGE